METSGALDFTHNDRREQQEDMARHHLRFRNIKSEAVRAAEVLFEARPHTQPAEVQLGIAQRFLVAVSDAYGVPVPDISFGGRRLRYTPGLVDSLGDDSIPATITLRRFSVLNLFRGARQHLLAEGVVQANGASDDLGWAASLYYTVRPVQFRKIARQGRVPNVHPQDTYSTETWERMRNVGVVNQWDRLLVPNFDPRDLEAIENGDIDPFGREEPAEAPVEDESDVYAAQVEDGEVACGECGGEGYFEPEDDESDPEECPVCHGNGVVPAAVGTVQAEAETEEILSDPETLAAIEEGERDLEEGNVSDTPDDGLDALGIVKLRKLGSGQGIEGMWDLGVNDLRAALRAKGITATS